ncbi:uncharacterized protein LOC110459918 [Mizuhopecten yessoensis]|uniref:uncharacterized protein LOC110459918 n=1 Tax=Mizuhopecten yessoensis TaxID=6573 RepID=UPI000B45D014|nr:uncharacterized protein LOC110459918 [Mizuhopecten yessoensis]
MGKDKNHQNDGHTKIRNDDPSSKTTQNATQNTQFPQFLVMTSTQSGKTTAALSPLLLRKGIQGIAGDVKSVKPLGSGDLLIEVYRQQQAMNLLGTTSFAGIGVSVKPHSSLNCSKGVIRCPALRNDTDEDILAYFQEESVPVSEVRRMVIRRNNDTIKTNTFIITFSTPTLPQILTIGYQRYNVSVYIPNPLRCRNCQKYGHHEKRCRRKSICQYCGREGHTEQNDCDIANLRCVNCEGKHAASSLDCPTWSQEREILRVKYTRGVSFPRGQEDSRECRRCYTLLRTSDSRQGENPPKAGPSRAQMRSQRSRSLKSVPRSQMRQDVTSPTNRPRKIRIARGKSDGPDLNVTFGKGSEDQTNRFNVLLDYDDEMETISLAPRASTSSKSSQNSKR